MDIRRKNANSMSFNTDMRSFMTCMLSNFANGPRFMRISIPEIGTYLIAGQSQVKIARAKKGH